MTPEELRPYLLSVSLAASNMANGGDSKDLGEACRLLEAEVVKQSRAAFNAGLETGEKIVREMRRPQEKINEKDPYDIAWDRFGIEAEDAIRRARLSQKEVDRKDNAENG